MTNVRNSGNRKFASAAMIQVKQVHTYSKYRTRYQNRNWAQHVVSCTMSRWFTSSLLRLKSLKRTVKHTFMQIQIFTNTIKEIETDVSFIHWVFQLLYIIFMYIQGESIKSIYYLNNSLATSFIEKRFKRIVLRFKRFIERTQLYFSIFYVFPGIELTLSFLNGIPFSTT